LRMPKVDLEVVYPQKDKDIYEDKFRRIQEDAASLQRTYNGSEIIKRFIAPRRL